MSDIDHEKFSLIPIYKIRNPFVRFFVVIICAPFILAGCVLGGASEGLSFAVASIAAALIGENRSNVKN